MSTERGTGAAATDEILARQAVKITPAHPSAPMQEKPALAQLTLRSPPPARAGMQPTLGSKDIAARGNLDIAAGLKMRCAGSTAGARHCSFWHDAPGGLAYF